MRNHSLKETVLLIRQNLLAFSQSLFVRLLVTSYISFYLNFTSCTLSPIESSDQVANFDKFKKKTRLRVLVRVGNVSQASMIVLFSKYV